LIRGEIWERRRNKYGTDVLLERPGGTTGGIFNATVMLNTELSSLSTTPAGRDGVSIRAPEGGSEHYWVAVHSIDGVKEKC